jgi:hypothetical protein
MPDGGAGVERIAEPRAAAQQPLLIETHGWSQLGGTIPGPFEWGGMPDVLTPLPDIAVQIS